MSIWGKSNKTNKLYEDRTTGKTEEMGCAGQLTEILKPRTIPGATVLDVGCGAGYFYHSLSKIGLEYYGVDPTEKYIEIGKRNLSKYGLNPDHLQVKGIEEIEGQYDIVVCFNVIQHLPVNLEIYLEILANSTKQFMVIRTSLYDSNDIIKEYGIDRENQKLKFLNVTYPKKMVEKILKGLSFKSKFLVDVYAGVKPERMYLNDVLIYPVICLASRC